MTTYLNPGQTKLPGCYSTEKFQECMDNGWLERNLCKHPDRHNTYHRVTRKPCRPCHPMSEVGKK